MSKEKYKGSHSNCLFFFENKNFKPGRSEGICPHFYHCKNTENNKDRHRSLKWIRGYTMGKVNNIKIKTSLGEENGD